MIQSLAQELKPKNIGDSEPEFNEQEQIDSPDIPLQQRLELLQALDQSNVRLGVYLLFLFRFRRFIRGFDMDKPLKLLEVGPGLGGLSMRLARRLASCLPVEVHLIDIHEDVLQVAQSRLQEAGIKCVYHLARTKHLEQFQDNQFDFVYSLHVLHHIHPRIEMAKALEQSIRISSKGFFHFDFHRSLLEPFFFWSFQHIFRFKAELIEDGRKSFRRSYSQAQFQFSIQEGMNAFPRGEISCKVDKVPLFPYFEISGVKR